MKAIQARIAAIIVSFIVATLASRGVSGLTPEAAAEIERWVSHTFELFLFLGYAILHPILQKRFARSGAVSEPKRQP